ncbi:MAG: DUF2953 domain-containing protein [Lachnospiraceae bacterium]|nr:DUF2953 domain-containing protein [Lachnospiraceae bacterium]
MALVLSILLLILKIIGIILLVLLGLIVLIVCLVLFVPIRYRASVIYNDEDKLDYKVQVTYLLHAVSVILEKGKSLNIKIFGISLDKIKKKKAKDKKYDEDTAMFEEMSVQYNEEIKKIPEDYKEFKDNLQKEEELSFVGEDDAKTDQVPMEEVDDSSKDSEEKSTIENIVNKIKNVINKIKSIPGKIKNTFIGIKNKIKNIFTKIYGIIKKVSNGWSFIRDFLDKEENIKSLKLVKDEIIRLLKHVSPRKIKGHITFGFEDPSTTGQTLGIIYMITGGRVGSGVTKHLEINPDFEHEIKDVDVEVKGHLQIYVIVLIAYKLYKDKNLMDLIKNRRKHG